MALQGTLRDFALPDIIQLISLGKKTGAIEITGGEGEGTGLLYFDGGRVVSATYQNLSAKDAACYFFIFQSGYFRFIEGELPPPGRQINLSNEMVILEGIKRAEEWKQIRNGLPSLDVVLRLVVEPGGGMREISLKPDEWRVLTMINGRDTIRNIGAKTGFGDMKTAQIVQELLQAGLIEPAQVTPSTEPLAAPGTSQTGSLINPLPGTGPLRSDPVRPINGKPYRRVPGTVPLSEESLQQYLGAAPASETNAAPTTPQPANEDLPPWQQPTMPAAQPTQQPGHIADPARGTLLFQRLEGLAISELGITGRMLLNEAYRRLRIAPGADLPAVSAGDLCDQFERTANLLIGPVRARNLSNMLRRAAAEIYA